MRHVIARIVDASDFLEFKAEYGPGTVCGHAAIAGFRVGIVTNNGPLDPAGSTKVTHFVQACCQLGTPIVWLQNTTGFIVGSEAERAGMIKHGSKQIQALSNANVAQITVQCGASFGAGNYGMCGRGFGPRFVFAWPTAKTAVMGAEQAAGTMEIVMREGAARKGEPVDEAKLAALEGQDRRHLRAPGRRLLHVGAAARRRHHRPARHAPRRRPGAGRLRRGGAAHPSSDAVRRRPALSAARPHEETRCSTRTSTRRSSARSSASSTRRSIPTSTSGRRPRRFPRTRSSSASASSACSA